MNKLTAHTLPLYFDSLRCIRCIVIISVLSCWRGKASCTNLQGKNRLMLAAGSGDIVAVEKLLAVGAYVSAVSTTVSKCAVAAA